MGFEINRVLPGITHIRDCMGVCMTLLAGTERALLVDAGYGVEDVLSFVRTLTDKPLTVLLTHNHHDHAMGARWFDKTMMFAADMQEWPVFTGLEKRRVVLEQAHAKGLAVTEEEFLRGECRMPECASAGAMDLGGITAQIIPCPGHTPGSCVVYVPEHRLLLTGDDWNPCTWLFFEAALDVWSYRDNLLGLMALPFEQVLCSHQLDLYPRAKVEEFASHLNGENFRNAAPVTIGPYGHIATRQADMGEGQILVFDWNKAQRAWR